MCIEPVGEGAKRVTTVAVGHRVEPEGWEGPEAERAPLSTRRSRAPSLARRRAWVGAEVEAQAERWALWTPVAFGAGAAIYFGLKREPQPWAGLPASPSPWPRLLARQPWGRSRALSAAALLAFGARRLRGPSCDAGASWLRPWRARRRASP